MGQFIAMNKICSGCGEIYHEDEFHAGQTWCKYCDTPGTERITTQEYKQTIICDGCDNELEINLRQVSHSEETVVLHVWPCRICIQV